MDLKSFKKLYKYYSGQLLERQVWQTSEYELYTEAIHTDKICSDWYLKQAIKGAGINYKKYCCLDMAYHIIEYKKSKRQKEINYDSVIKQNGTDFGIPIHDGGNSYIRIVFCPWCGKEL